MKIVNINLLSKFIGYLSKGNINDLYALSNCQTLPYQNANVLIVNRGNINKGKEKWVREGLNAVLGRIYHESGDHNNAYKYFIAAEIEQDEKLKTETWYAYKLEDYERAAKSFERYKKIQEISTDDSEWLAEIYHKTGEWKKEATTLWSILRYFDAAKIVYEYTKDPIVFRNAAEAYLKYVRTPYMLEKKNSHEMAAKCFEAGGFFKEAREIYKRRKMFADVKRIEEFIPRKVPKKPIEKKRPAIKLERKPK